MELCRFLSFIRTSNIKNIETYNDSIYVSIQSEFLIISSKRLSVTFNNAVNYNYNFKFTYIYFNGNISSDMFHHVLRNGH